MELHQIQANLLNPDFQYRLKAIAALKDYPSEVAVPILKQHIRDEEFLVRTFVAMGLGKQQTSDSFAALLDLMKFDNTPNVRSQAANSLSLFGQISASHLVKTFIRDEHWLVRVSILGALVDLECAEELLEVCLCALAAEDMSVQEAAIDALGTLAGSRQHQAALCPLLALKNSPSERIRVKVAYALPRFDEPEAKEALIQLRADPVYRVVGAAMEDLLP
ncbi:HEAT repeat domain-containing protein [Merismopedia glauca]|uniref:Phycocyanobilin lyase n=1 Tax=Merismopedia glauca CCAP 1448/3 TaxID=1296344 RepID=A0A2T1C9R2_9CYAN|nr:HEAT repeat domain-containing protein [Merismopedia glauca]PSB04883.1 phycocyanobilin lyase [Merismopedia glauca CCAP 1448/3]